MRKLLCVSPPDGGGRRRPPPRRSRRHRVQKQRRAGGRRGTRARLAWTARQRPQSQRLRAVRRRPEADADQRVVRAEPCERRHPDGCQRQHGRQDGARARDGERAGRRPQARVPTKSRSIRSTRRCRKCARSRRRSRRNDAWAATKAYGATSLWDAIAETAQRISDRQRRRALVVITDGVDSASTMKPADVSAIASSLDVPVYILVIGFALDEAVREAPIRGPMADLAAWTGGDSLAVNDTPGALAAARQLLPSSIINTSSRSSPAPRRDGTRSCCGRASRDSSSARAAATW